MIRIFAAIGIGCVFLFFIVLLACLMTAAEQDSPEEQMACIEREMAEQARKKQARKAKKMARKEKLLSRARAPKRGCWRRLIRRKGGEDNEPGTAD